MGSGWIKEHTERHEQYEFRRKLTRELSGLDLTDEEARLLLRILDPWEFERWTEDRGLKGLKISPGAVEQWELGWQMTAHLKGRLTLADVQDRGHQIVTALGLKTGVYTEFEEDRDPAPAMIAAGMVANHRKRHGSVLMVLPGDRSDRAELWFGMSDQLAQVAAAQDRMRALHAAAEREREEEREAVKQAAKEAGQASPEELAQSLEFQHRFAAEFAREQVTESPRDGAVRPSGALGGRGRTSVCEDVRAVLTEVPGGLSAAEIASKTERALSKVYACLNEGLDTGEYVKIRKLYTLAPTITEEEN